MLVHREHVLAAKPDSTILELLQEAKIPIEGKLLRMLQLLTCHVYVDEAWFDRLDP